MFQVQDWAEAHRLLHRERWAKMKIVETLGMSRNTVVRLFELDDPPQYQRVPRGSKLDPCRVRLSRCSMRIRRCRLRSSSSISVAMASGVELPVVTLRTK